MTSDEELDEVSERRPPLVRSRIDLLEKFIREQCKAYRLPDKLWFRIRPEKFDGVEVEVNSPEYMSKIIFTGEWFHRIVTKELAKTYFKDRVKEVIRLFRQIGVI